MFRSDLTNLSTTDCTHLCLVDGKEYGRADGSTVKDAQKIAAGQALIALRK